MGAHFTWSNHQASPVRSVLDRVFVPDRWHTLFPRALLKARPAVGSDHVPLVLDTGILAIATTSRFQFDASWLMVEGFYDMLGSRISSFFLLLYAPLVLLMIGVNFLTSFANSLRGGLETGRLGPVKKKTP